jgi:transitional endoplasmic reticulum ATPase
VLLYGPPGCGKTILAKATASESGANLIIVRGPEILSKWVGESEKGIREIFRKAKASVPCIIIFDEIDSIAKPRSYSAEDSGVGERVLSQLLTEIDSTHSTTEVFVIGATNRPDLIDVSLLRPGRLDLLVYVPPPDDEGRLEILKILTSKMPLSKGVNLEQIAINLKGHSGADLDSLCREAAIISLERDSENTTVTKLDFEVAIKKVRPSLSTEIIQGYESFYKQLKGGNIKLSDRLYK